MTVTLKFQSSGTIPGGAQPAQMRGGSLTIGRGPENDMVLPDPDRMLSKNHCVVEDHNGNVLVVDLSTNGTFLNYSKIPLGKIPTPLNNGDILCIGTYELLVEIGGELPDLDDMIAAPAAQRIRVSPATGSSSAESESAAGHAPLLSPWILRLRGTTRGAPLVGVKSSRARMMLTYAVHPGKNDRSACTGWRASGWRGRGS